MRTTLTFLVACVMFTLHAQTGEIRGTVIDEGFGEPIIGANVVVTELTEQSVGASSDLDGKFNIIVAGKASLDGDFLKGSFGRFFGKSLNFVHARHLFGFIGMNFCSKLNRK